MTASPELPAVRWISDARFNRQVSEAGFDHHYGALWGPRHDQRVSLRLPAGAPAGVLYAYDPLWDEYAILHPDAAHVDVEAAFARIVKWNGPAGVDVSELAHHLQTVTRGSQPRSDPLAVRIDYQLTPSGRDALDAAKAAIGGVRVRHHSGAGTMTGRGPGSASAANSDAERVR